MITKRVTQQPTPAQRTAIGPRTPDVDDVDDVVSVYLLVSLPGALACLLRAS